jgi:hypothetical protein
MKSRAIRQKQSALVSREALDRQRSTFERFSALAVLFLSFAGTIAAFSGGWSALVSAPRLAPILVGLVTQALLTAGQWWYGARRGPWRYRAALLIDSALTTAGYGPLIVPWLGGYLARRIAPAGQVAEGYLVLAEPIAWGLLVVASALIAWYPEKTLIDD